MVLNDGRLPYTEYEYQNHLDMQNAVVEGVRPKLPEDCPEALTSILTRCWSGNVDDRPPFATIAEYLGQLRVQ